jgi:glycosyltransferase involved in cell wall biosynthesis
VSSSSALRVVHVFRAPLGGLFRHVVDLATMQAARGHEIGLFFDTGGDGERVREAIARIPGGPRLGVGMAPIARAPHLSDIAALRAFHRFLERARPDIVHGHGSKGGVYARLAGGSGAIRAYTPHGGSFNYRPGGPAHRLYMLVERALSARTELYLFESAHVGRLCAEAVGRRPGLARIVVNGLDAREFAPVAPAADAADFLYVGELRAAKGVDTLIDALALLSAGDARPPSAVLVGSGPDRDALIARAARLGVAARFPGPMPAREAFRLGRVMVAPSRAESLPYIVLETLAAEVPLLTTNVGGVPEIFGPFADRLGPPDDPADLARRMAEELQRPQAERARRAAELAAHVRGEFSLENMADTVISAYREALADRDARGPAGRRGATASALVKEA